MTRKPVFNKLGSEIPVSLNEVTPDFHLLHLPTIVVALLYSDPCTILPCTQVILLTCWLGQLASETKDPGGLAGHQSAVVSNCFVLQLFCACTHTLYIITIVTSVSSFFVLVNSFAFCFYLYL